MLLREMFLESDIWIDIWLKCEKDVLDMWEKKMLGREKDDDR